MIKFSKEEGFIKPTGLEFRENQDHNIKLPKVAVCVETEGATIAAVCKKLNLNYFTFYYADATLQVKKWDERSIKSLTNIDKKKEVALLALELALQINNS